MPTPTRLLAQRLPKPHPNGDGGELGSVVGGWEVMVLNGFFGHRPLLAEVKKSGANPENRGQILISYAPNFER
jgi:hypothetical protein